MHGTMPAIPRQSNRHAAEFCSEKFREAKRRGFFRVAAKYAFPRKTVPAVQALTGVGERTVYDWLSGKTDAPVSALLAILGEIGRE